MFDGLNKFGLPTKYGIVGALGGLLGSFIAQLLSVHEGELSSYVISILATAVGGALGGWIRQRRGMSN